MISGSTSPQCDSQQHFTHELCRSCSSDVHYMSWCPNMDLLALAFSSRHVEVRRLSWQRLFEPILIQSSVKHDESSSSSVFTISCLCWRPDGNVLAIATSHGCIRLHSVESGQQISSIQCHRTIICTMCWISAATNDDSDFAENSKNGFAAINACKQSFNWTCEGSPSASEYLAPLRDIPKRSARTYNDTNTAGQTSFVERRVDPDSLNVLVSGDDDGILHVSAFGTFSLARVCCKQRLQGMWFIPCTNHHESFVCRITQVHLSHDMRHISLIVRINAATTSNNESLSVSSTSSCVIVYMLLDTHVLAERSHELRLLATQSEQIKFLMHYLHQCLSSLYTLWKDARRSLDMKIDTLRSVLRDYDKDVNDVNDELMDMLVQGEPSEALHQFLTQYMGEQSLTRLRNNLVNGCHQLALAIRLNIHAALEEIVTRLTCLRSLAHCPDRHHVIGLDLDGLNALIETSTAMMMKCDELLNCITHYRIDFLHFFAWIIQCVNALADEPNSLSYVTNIVCIDTSKVARFIQYSLHHDIIASYLSASHLPPSHLINIHTSSSPPPSSSSPPYLIERWASRSQCTLHSLLHELRTQWTFARELPLQRISSSLCLAAVFPLCNIPSSSSPVLSFALTSRCRAEWRHTTPIPDQHVLCFIDTDNANKQTHSTIYMLSVNDTHTSSSSSSSCTLSFLRHQSCVTHISFYTHDKLAIASSHSHTNTRDCSSSVNTRLSLLHFTYHDTKSSTSSCNSVLSYNELSSCFLLCPARLNTAQPLDVLSHRTRLLEHVHTTRVTSCAARGMLALLAGTRRVNLLDMNNDDDDDDDDDDNDDDT